MATVQSELMTAEEFLDWCSRPENRNRRFELDRGEIVEMPPPGTPHGFICGWIAHLLWNYVLQRKSGLVVTNDTGLLVSRGPDSVRGPDVILFEHAQPLEQLPRTPNPQIPLLIAEVISPSDTWPEMLRRVGQYTQRGVRLVWVFDPDTRTVTVFRPGEIQQVLTEQDALTGDGILPDLRLPVADLFRVPGTAPTDQGTP
jgi:Uma2 family endonuclease